MLKTSKEHTLAPKIQAFISNKVKQEKINYSFIDLPSPKQILLIFSQ